VSQDVSAFEGFFLELRRRRVINVVILYVVAAATILATASEITQWLPIPGEQETQMGVLTALTLGAFPVVLVLSWMFDVSAQGIQRTTSDVSGAAKLGFMKVLGLILSLLLSAAVGYWLWP